MNDTSHHPQNPPLKPQKQNQIKEIHLQTSPASSQPQLIPIIKVVQSQLQINSNFEILIKKQTSLPLVIFSVTGDRKVGKTFLLNQFVTYSDTINDVGIYAVSTLLQDEKKTILILEVKLPSTVNQIYNKLFNLIYVSQHNLGSELFHAFQVLKNMKEWSGMDQKNLLNSMPRLVIGLNKQENKSSYHPNQILHNWLYDEHSFTVDSQEQKQIRKKMIKYFISKDLVYLENSASSNQSVLDQQKIIIKKKIFKNLQRKMLHGVILDKVNLIPFVDNLIQGLDLEQPCDVKSIINLVVENELINYYNEALDYFQQLIIHNFQDSAVYNLDDALKILEDIREQALEKFMDFKSRCGAQQLDQFEDYKKQLVEKIYIREQEVLTIGAQQIIEKCKIKMNETLKKTQAQIKNSSFSLKDLEQIVENYKQLNTQLQTITLGNSPYNQIFAMIQQTQNNMITAFYRELSEIHKNDNIQQMNFKEAIKEHEQKKLEFEKSHKNVDQQLSQIKGQTQEYQETINKLAKLEQEHNNQQKVIQNLQTANKKLTEQLEASKKLEKKCF